MDKLTNEFILDNVENGFYLYYEHIKYVKDKLEYADKMKSIEKGLECPLEVVSKALKGINYVDDAGDLCQYQRPRLYYSDDLKCWCWELFLGSYVLPLKDYKKTWWLFKTKEK